MATSSGYPLHRPELYDRLERGELSTLRTMMTNERLFGAGEEIIRCGERHDFVYRIRTGWAVRTRSLDDGRRQIVMVFLPGDLCGIKCMLMSRQPDSLQALTPVTANAVDQASMRALSDSDADVALRLMFQLGEDERRLHNWAVALGRGTAEERLATFFLEIRGRLRRIGLARTSFGLPMTQQQIGDHLGLTVVHVNRVLRRFREAGVLTLTRRMVTSIQVEQLRRIAAPMLDVFERSAPEFA